jgi:hypothetical protein
LSSGFWHLFPPDAEKQERPRENRKFRQARQKGPLHSNLCSGPWENQTIQNSLRVRSGSVLRKYYL